MPVCSFTLQHAGTPETLFPVARTAITQRGGDISGSSSSGNVRMPSPVGDVFFDYTARGSSLAIAVTDKPFLASCGRIQSELAAVLAKVPAAEPIDVQAEEIHRTVVAAATVQPTARTTRPRVEVVDEERLQTFYSFSDTEAGAVYANPKRSSGLNWPLLAGTAAGLAVGGYLLLARNKRSARKPRRRRSTVRAMKF